MSKTARTHGSTSSKWAFRSACTLKAFPLISPPSPLSAPDEAKHLPCTQGCSNACTADSRDVESTVSSFATMSFASAEMFSQIGSSAS